MTEEEEVIPLEVKVTNQPKEEKEVDFPDEEFEIAPYITEEEIKEFEKDNA